MFKPILTAGICLIIASLASAERLVCSYDSAAASRAEGGRVLIRDIDPSLCTHLVYGYASISSSNELVPRASDTDQYQSFNNLKTRNANLKTFLSVGGPDFDNTKFKTMTASPNSRTTFSRSAITLLRTYGFDGLNVDWRYPTNPAEKNRFSALVQHLREQFDLEGLTTSRTILLLTASVSAEKTIVDDAYDIPAIAQNLNFINVMTYNLLPAAAVTKHHSPLFQGSGDAQLNVDFAMTYWRDQGTPTNKLNMGIPAFGRSFTLSSADARLGAPTSGVGEEGCFSGEPGLWASYESCIYLEGVTTQTITDQGVPFATTENQWVGFDDAASITRKINYIKSNDYGGAFLSSLDLDDFNGQYCKMGEYPLINQLHNGLVTAVGNDAGNAATTRAATPMAGNAATTRAATPMAGNAATTRAAMPTAGDAAIAATTTAANAGAGNSGGVDCVGRTDGVHAHPFDQTKFLSCDHSTVTVFNCPASLVFRTSCLCCDFP